VSIALIKLESYGSAIADANEAIKLDPKYIKAYYRRGSSNFALGKYIEARRDFQSIVKIVPNDPDALKKLKACEKAVREKAFAEAIEAEEESGSSSMVVDYDTIEIESSYDGPRLSDVPGDACKVSTEFLMEMIEHFKSQKVLHRKYVLKILTAAREHFRRSDSLLRLSLPQCDESGTEGEGHFTICGDTHGQFYDLCNIFHIGGFPNERNPYLFNGDFVDRGSFSFEVVFTLIAIKLSNPDALFMLRGNHETKNMNKIYGFEGEILHKYDVTVYNLFSEVFSWLPLAAVIQSAVMVVHGGLSTKDDGSFLLDEIDNIPRGKEPPETGLMSDLLWSDPQHAMGRSRSKRGVGFSFGPDISQNFLTANNLKLIVRSHEVKDEGYVVEHDGKCITIFSAPNYWYTYMIYIFCNKLNFDCFNIITFSIYPQRPNGQQRSIYPL
jgi:serine/threonine-protein phosphatase 5